MKRTITTVVLLIGLSNILAQTNKTFFLGHSLINFNVPNFVDKLSAAAGDTFSYNANIGNGANLQWHWNRPYSGQGSIWDTTLTKGGFENIILTEAVPLLNHINGSNTYRYTDSFCSFANTHNANIQYYMYETWHCTNSGNGSTSGSGGYPCSWDAGSNVPWRTRLDNDLKHWETIADSINLIHTNPMLIIPGGQALARLSDSIDSDYIPGLDSVFELFVDEHHLDLRGNYFIACVMYSVIHGKSPVGLPNRLTNQYGTLVSTYPTVAQATAFQEIAWQTVCDYQRDGVSCSPTSISKDSPINTTVSVYPNPSTGIFTIESNKSVSQIEVMNLAGKKIYKQTQDFREIHLNHLPKGIYFVSILTNENKRITKKIIIQ